MLKTHLVRGLAIFPILPRGSQNNPRRKGGRSEHGQGNHASGRATMHRLRQCPWLSCYAPVGRSVLSPSRLPSLSVSEIEFLQKPLITFICGSDGGKGEHNTYMKVRKQLVRACSFLPACELARLELTQVAKPDSKHLSFPV